LFWYKFRCVCTLATKIHGESHFLALISHGSM
jgi:hypothetical protein